ncbi:hypothetical protein [Nonomuraea sp. NPDC049695]|uniref:hypothetical protein n=1 Tax=Nonomuraea sp. NPDC049695 TaxID=3154734 RepID=UPI00343F8032
MDEVWNGIRTLDYEHTRPTATPLEWELYTTSVISWPLVLMDESTPYGTLRRPGIVDVPDVLHRRLVAAWHARLTETRYVGRLITSTADARARTGDALTGLECALRHGDQAAAGAAIAAATRGLLTVMSTHIVNWLLPETAWQATLTGLLGNHAEAAACLSALMTPSAPGRLLRAHLTTATTADTSSGAAQASDHALCLADAWTMALQLAAAGDDDATDRVRTLTALTRWAADSEERRAELRDRYLAAIPRWRLLTGTLIDDAQLTTAHLMEETGACL